MEITTQQRVGRRILQHVRAIAFPRFTGTHGERKAQSYIQTVFHQAGYYINENEFTSSLYPLEVFPRLVIAVLCTLVVGAYLCVEEIPVLSIELCVLTVLIFLFASRWNGLFEKMYSFKKFGELHSKNMIAIHPHQKNHINVVFTAHYDSKSQTFSGVTRFVLYAILAVVLITNICFISAEIFFHWNHLILLIPLIPMCIVGIILQFNATHNHSPGAYDNASGVGVMLELAIANGQEPRGVNLAFVATGAEEAGLCGAVALMHDGRFLEHFPPSRTIIINFDGVGCEGPVQITDRYGIPPAYTGKLVSKLCVKIGERFGIKTKRNWMPTGAAMDHIPLSYHGYQTVTLSTASYSHTFRAMHTSDDVIDNLSIQSLEHCFAIGQEIIDSIPSTQYLASTN